MEQGTTAWYDARRGKVTSSRIADVVAQTSSKSALCTLDPEGKIIGILGNGKAAERKAEKARAQGIPVEMRVYKSAESGASRDNYMAELIAERLTGVTTERFLSVAMQWGLAHEEDAIDAYAWRSEAELERPGFIEHPVIRMSGSSPDRRVVGTRGLVEAKCPNTATHIKTLLGEPIAREYILQMQWQMDTDDRDWCDFVSYDPRLSLEYQLYVQRVPRSEEVINELRHAVERFHDELEAKLERLKALATAG